MQPKKNPKADLQNKRGLFLEIGLVISLGAVILAMGVSQKEKVIQQMVVSQATDEVELVEITIEEEEKKPTEPVKQTISVISDILNVVKNDTQITTDFDFAEFTEEEINLTTLDVTTEEIEEETPFLFAEEMPKFEGGDLTKVRAWVQKNFRYPVVAQENGIQGRVVLAFVIEKDGTLSNIEVLLTPDSSLSDEAVRILKTSPKWTPGKQRNVPVRVKFTLPIEFQITN